MNYSDKFGSFFGRVTAAGDVAVFSTDGAAATSLDCSLYAVGSDGSQSVRYEHPDGIVLSAADAARIGLEIE